MPVCQRCRDSPVKHVATHDIGVADGTRTRDTQDHNLVLYQLNYSHHRCVFSSGNYLSTRSLNHKNGW